MNFSNYRLSLDIHETESGLSLRAKKGDTIRKIYVTLMDGGVPYRITSDCTAAFTARKPDNTIIFNDALIENNAIVYELTPQTTSAAGQVRCEVRLYGGDGRLITSPRFFLDVDDTVFTEGDQVVSEDEYTILEDAIDAVHRAVAEAEAAVDQIAADFQKKVDSGQFTDAVSNAFLHKTGGTMSGDIAMAGHKVTGLGTPTDAADAVPKSYADGKVAKTEKTATLSASGWSNLSQTVSVSGVTANNTVIVTPAPASYTACLEAGAYCSGQSAGMLTFTCATVPSVSVTYNILILE